MKPRKRKGLTPKQRVQYCVYDKSIVPYLLRFAHEAADAVEKVRKKYPDCGVGAMFTVLAHRVATVATNAAQGKPLKREYLSAPRRKP